VFFGCRLLKVVRIGRVGSVNRKALAGGSVEAILPLGVTGLDTLGLREALAYIRPPTQTVVVSGAWAAAEDAGGSCLVELNVGPGSPLPTVGDCRWLASIDLSSVESLPLGWAPSGCRFLRSVLLPVHLVEPSDEFFSVCFNLVSMNLHACVRLRVIGKRAFRKCVNLGIMELPACLEEVDLSWSGVETLDMRGRL
jgi:hypothetical protein